MKTGILLVAFGTSIPEAQVSFKKIEEKVKKAHPDVPVRWAFTSHIIRNILTERGQNYDSPEVALAKMMDEGFTHVAVQSLHTILGEEFHGLLENAHKFKGMAGGMQKVFVGYPLMAVDEDIERGWTHPRIQRKNPTRGIPVFLPEVGFFSISSDVWGLDTTRCAEVWLDNLDSFFYEYRLVRVLESSRKGNPVRVGDGPAAVSGDESSKMPLSIRMGRRCE